MESTPTQLEYAAKSPDSTKSRHESALVCRSEMYCRNQRTSNKVLVYHGPSLLARTQAGVSNGASSWQMPAAVTEITGRRSGWTSARIFLASKTESVK